MCSYVLCIRYSCINFILFLQLVCYYTNWSQYRTKIGKFMPEDIQPDLCTHVIFAFGWLKKNKLTSFESNDETKDGKIGLYERVVNLKKANPSLKILLAIGKFVLFHVRIILSKIIDPGHKIKIILCSFYACSVNSMIIIFCDI